MMTSPTARLVSTSSPTLKKLVLFKNKHLSLQAFATSATLRSQQLKSDVDFSQAIEDFKTNGIAILPLQIDEKFVNKSKELVVSAWQDALLRARIIKGHEMKVGNKFGFKEMVLRAPGRFDMQWRIDGEEHFMDPQNVLSKFLPFVHEVFGGEKMTSLNFNGCLMSLPGAKEQLWHIDGEHLYTSEENVRCYGDNNVTFFDREKDERKDNSILPAHCLNIFIPLVDVESNNGGTEFCLGSHFHTKFFSDDIVWQDKTWKDRIGFKGDVMAVKVNAGEVLAFDYRVLHRALEHGGKEARPLLYYTFTKRWFSDAMNFADLPSLKEADEKCLESVKDCDGQRWRKNFTGVSENEERIYCDGAGGSQIPSSVAEKIRQYLLGVGNTNVGGNYPMSAAALDAVTAARNAGKDLLGASSSGEIAFGLNCSNLMFHLSRSMEKSDWLQPGDNIVLSTACHDANIAPWLLLANNKKLEVRWLETVVGDVDHSNIDRIDLERIPGLIDDRTRVISLGLASNATGRIHLDVLDKINEMRETKLRPPFLILDGTHFVPHRRCNLTQLKADAVVCSAYKFFGPHVGVMAFNKDRFKELRPSKVGIRYGEDGTLDVLDCGDVPDVENCEISRWEMGTVNYEGLVGFEACVEYLSSLASQNMQGKERLDQAFGQIQIHEERLSERFISGIGLLLDQNILSLYGSRQSKDRTPTFAIYLNDRSDSRDPYFLVNKLNEEGIHCTHGNHYAPELVEKSLGKVEGVTRISFLHYNTLEEVDRVVAELQRICTP